jgi:hypothetical protein
MNTSTYRGLITQLATCVPALAHTRRIKGRPKSLCQKRDFPCYWTKNQNKDSTALGHPLPPVHLISLQRVTVAFNTSFFQNKYLIPNNAFLCLCTKSPFPSIWIVFWPQTLFPKNCGGLTVPSHLHTMPTDNKTWDSDYQIEAGIIAERALEMAQNQNWVLLWMGGSWHNRTLIWLSKDRDTGAQVTLICNSTWNSWKSTGEKLSQNRLRLAKNLTLTYTNNESW